MKILLLVLLVVSAMFLAHNYIQTGEIGFTSSLSEQEREIKRLDERLSGAWRSYRVAGRGTALGGMEGGSAAESALSEIRYVERELVRVKQQVETDREKERLSALEDKLREVKQEMGVG